MSDQQQVFSTSQTTGQATFTPHFALPELEKGAEARFSRPNPAIGTTSSVPPIQIAITIPGARLTRLGNVNARTQPNEITLTFTVHGNHIAVASAPKDAHPNMQHDWHMLLQESERLGALRYLLAEYQNRAVGNNGFNVAAIGVTNDNELFIAHNKYHTDPIKKQCAELSVINIALDSAKQATQPGYGNTVDEMDKPKALFKDFFVMGGAEERGIHAVCPCGLCTDAMYDHMSREEKDDKEPRNIYILPVPTAHGHAHESSGGEIPLPVLHAANEGTKNLSTVQLTEQYWKTDIEHLNGPFTYDLAEEVKTNQKNSLHAIVQKLQNSTALTPVPPTNETIDKLAEFLPKQNPELFAGETPEAIHLAARYALTNKPTLALVANAQGKPNNIPDIAELHRFMREEIHQQLSPWLQNEKYTAPSDLPSINHTLIRLKDGSYSSGIDILHKNDPATPHAQFVALTQRDALQSVANNDKVTHVWHMSFSPQAIEKGALPTPMRDGIERLVKRSEPGMKFSLLPYATPEAMPGTTSQGQSAEQQFTEFLNTHHKDVPLSEIYPAAWRGRVAEPKSQTRQA